MSRIEHRKNPAQTAVVAAQCRRRLTQIICLLRANRDAAHAAGSWLPPAPFLETQLAAAHASRETRARLQTHGLSGVQDRHYNMHEHLDETRAALEILHCLLTGTGAKVVPIKVKTSIT